MKVWLHYIQSRRSPNSNPRLMGIYGTKESAYAQIPKNANTTSYDHHISTKEVKGMP